MPDPNSTEERNKIRCPVCALPWGEHPDTICLRHKPTTAQPQPLIPLDHAKATGRNGHPTETPNYV